MTDGTEHTSVFFVRSGQEGVVGHGNPGDARWRESGQSSQ